jgi:glutamine amidotransferase
VSVAIVDLGYGNIGSIAVAFQRLGATVTVTADPREIGSAERVALPGVGAAGYAMERIDALGLRETLTALTRPLLGICLGMQLLFEASEEEDTLCLGLIAGKVRKLEPGPGLTVPHMGWSRLAVTDESSGLASGDYVYFAHSFACDDGSASIATVQHGRTIPAAVRQGNLIGAQFHPERSAEAGARFLKAFLSC